MRIRAYLSLLAAAVAVPVVVVSLWSMGMLRDSGRESALQAMHESARAASLAVDRELAASEARLRTFAVSDELLEGRLDALYATMQRASRSVDDGWMLLLDATGKTLVNTSAPLGTALPDIANPEQLTRLFSHNGIWFSDLVVAPLTGKPLVAAFLPVVLPDGHRYVLVEALLPTLFERLLHEERLAPAAKLGLFDRQGNYIARNPDHVETLGQPARPELKSAADKALNGKVRHLSRADAEVWSVFTHSGRGNYLVTLTLPAQAIEGAGREAITVAALGFGAALLLASLLAWVFGRHLAKSIDHAARASAALARGEMPDMVDTRVREVQGLQLAMQSAATLIGEERSSRLAVEQERERLLEQEQRARLWAEEQSKSKDAFLAMLGHELRNPLSSISAGIAVIQAAGPHTEVAARANEIIARQSAHLERIVDDLLDAARMLAGKISLVKKNFSLDESLHACVDALRATGRADDYQLQVSAQPLWVLADPARVDQIINNLLNNALKYTPAGGRISVKLERQGDQAVLQVADNGIGMQPELLEHVFDPFVQGKVSLDRAQGGLGVGLTLVKKLVELHGGSVRGESEGEGAGSRFTVVLPLAASSKVEPGAKETGFAQQGVCLLFVEDNDDARDMTTELLRLSGYRVTAVANGMNALRAARSEVFAVAVIDIGLPDIDGYELVRQLRQAPETRAIGLVALTGYGLESDVRRGREAGFDCHLVKPVNHQKLVQAIESARASRSHTA